MEIIWFFLLLFTGEALALWNDLNCPAPRSPENGLSFIFRNGELVHFRCHPGYVMHGKAVAYCVNSQWTVPAPECIPIRKGERKYRRNQDKSHDMYDNNNYQEFRAHLGHDRRNMTLSERRKELNSQLFNWEKRQKKKGVYGDGPRRLPLINGIWPGQPIQIMALGPQSTPGPKELVKEEVNIAELRQKQYEEVAKHRLTNPNLDLLPAKKRKGNKKRKNKKNKNSVIANNVNESSTRETVISLGSTEDGDALSIAFAKPANETNEITRINHHKYRHHDLRKKTRRGKAKAKKYNPHDYPPNVIARSSRVDTSGFSPYSVGYPTRAKFNKNEVAELRRRPVQQVRDEQLVDENKAQYDTSCVESFYGRDLPMMAPQVQHAFVYRYETKKNKDFPFNSYMQVKYRCLNGYTFVNVKAQVLNCREAKWVGEMPICAKD